VTIYLDHNATCPVAPEAAAAVRRAMEEEWANPASPHAPGLRARALIEQARREVADLIGSRPEEIIFTSGGTESNNLALAGCARARRTAGKRIVISAVEHAAVDQACDALEGEGFETVRVPVAEDGRVDAAAFIEALDQDTAVASLMHANNETGAIQPVAEVAEAARRLGIPLHTDAAQSAGKLPVGVDDLGVDLLTLAGHKLYGPKGVGALYRRAGTPLEPFLRGAAHEGGLRPGTHNTPGIAGLGAACALARVELAARARHARALIRELHAALAAGWPDLAVNGPLDPALRLPNTLNVSLPGIEAHRLVTEALGVALSFGTACHSGTATPSRVLAAMGLPPSRSLAALRISVGRDNTSAEMAEAASRLLAAARRLASPAPSIPV
jgi:cysteine desulfurase